MSNVARLTCLDGALTGKQYDLDASPVMLGSLPECAIVVADPAASRHHAQLLQTDGTWAIADQNSSNGTSVNGLPIATVPLRNGDIIKIGQTKFRFNDGGTLQTSEDDLRLVEAMRQRTDAIRNESAK